VLTVHIIWRNGWRKTATKCTDLHVTIQIFSGGYALEPLCWGGAKAPLHKPHPLGTPALRASLGASSVPQCLLAVDATDLSYACNLSLSILCMWISNLSRIQMTEKALWNKMKLFANSSLVKWTKNKSKGLSQAERWRSSGLEMWIRRISWKLTWEC